MKPPGLAQAMGMRVILVSNGFMAEDFLLPLRRRVNAVNVDLKSFSDDFYRDYCGGRLQPVLDNLKAHQGAGLVAGSDHPGHSGL